MAQRTTTRLDAPAQLSLGSSDDGLLEELAIMDTGIAKLVDAAFEIGRREKEIAKIQGETCGHCFAILRYWDILLTMQIQQSDAILKLPIEGDPIANLDRVMCVKEGYDASLQAIRNQCWQRINQHFNALQGLKANFPSLVNPIMTTMIQKLSLPPSVKTAKQAEETGEAPDITAMAILLESFWKPVDGQATGNITRDAGKIGQLDGFTTIRIGDVVTIYQNGHKIFGYDARESPLLEVSGHPNGIVVKDGSSILLYKLENDPGDSPPVVSILPLPDGD